MAFLFCREDITSYTEHRHPCRFGYHCLPSFLALIVGSTQTPQLDEKIVFEFCTTFKSNLIMYQLNVMLDAFPDSLNKSLRMHRYQRHKVNKQWYNYVYLHVCRRLPPQPLEKARIHIARHYYRTLDYDGLVGSLKPVVDALIYAKVIKSDSWNVLGAWEVTQVFRAKELGPLLTIQVDEIE